jgi:AraC family transcriptional regulator
MNANLLATNGQRNAELEYQAHIMAVLAYIQEHLDEPLRLDVLANVAGFSPFHFHRIFTAFVGETVADYVRRIRLQRAAQQLLDTAQSITEIALSSGYETPAAFTKAFRQYFAITPSKLREVRDRSATTIVISQKTKFNKRSIIMQAEIRSLPDQRVLYARQKGIVNGDFSQAAQTAFHQLYSYIGQHNLKEQVSSACLGITPDEPSVVPDEECRYDAGVFVNDNQQIDLLPGDPVDIQILPGGRYAVFLHKGPYRTLGQTWRAIYREWLPKSGETLRDVPPYEVYVDDPQQTRPEDLRTEIFVPIR